ncbi:BCCT family transporter [Corynebacterium incognita]|uniref:BCCT family transporter n=1 Tax=Corynebacterium incognita TaxID=2754725 RepID=A0A7G7CNQ0_9CORY|nr:BCCT family transporter [Corynebacterium incognita]QNE89216.1 BCCT family transporter [Corynebacterium incognita]
MDQSEVENSKSRAPHSDGSSEEVVANQGAQDDTQQVLATEELEQQSATEQLAYILDSDVEIDPNKLHVSEEVDLIADSRNLKIDWGIVIPTAILIAGIVAWGLGASESFATFSEDALGFVVNNVGWAFVLFGTVFVAFVLAIAVSRFGTIKLGAMDEEPEFKTTSWIAMMFAAGMGIGLMFYGASEPLTFYRNGVPGHEPNEVSAAMASAMFHWTLHPWAVYAIVGLAIAYSTFRIGRKQLLSSAFVPLIGKEAADGWVGKIIDILAIFATVFGTACSLGLGALQISSGLKASGLVEDTSDMLLVGIVSVLTLAFVLSAMSGVGKGIQYISNANMVLAAILAIFVFVLGPTINILNLIPGSVGAYLDQFTEMIGRTAEYANGTAGEWLGSWTIFYWAWWISWSPFVGMFLARISRGRSIREFCVGVMLIPAGVSTVWFAIFGGTAIHFEQTGQSIWGDGSAESQLFNLLHTLPGGFVAGIVAMILLGTFFITSADSASTVMGSMSQNGSVNAKPWLSASWGVLTALVGITLLLANEDALSNLQNVTIVAASPFLIILVALMFAIVKDLRNDVIYQDIREQQIFGRKLARERRLIREERMRQIRTNKAQRAQREYRESLKDAKKAAKKAK